MECKVRRQKAVENRMQEKENGFENSKWKSILKWKEDEN